MSNDTDSTKRPELFFAVVGAAGTRVDDLSNSLVDALKQFGYRTMDIRLSALLQNYSGWKQQEGTGEYRRIRHLQEMGDAFRRELQDCSGLARAGIADIRRCRASLTGSEDQPVDACAYIIRQLKHPDEVELLREVYGSSFWLIAGHAPRHVRAVDLARRMAKAADKPNDVDRHRGDAEAVIEVDEKEEDDFGQNTRDTYPQADFFANLGVERGELKVKRLVDLIFGHPFCTPSPDEYAMYQASAAALRSSDANRQVGAVIVRLSQNSQGRVSDADIVAVGMNEVPRGGGGFYWDEDSPDSRDQWIARYLREDRATEIKISALTELIERICQQQWLVGGIAQQAASDLARNLLPHLKRTQFMDIGEFGRTVHAEMAAVIDSAKRGVAIGGLTMYVTAFPCHNCAKHMIAAGLRRVVYLEPYRKSRANMLHREEIELESVDGRHSGDKLVFIAYTGIAPRQYRTLFSMSERGADRGIKLKTWEDGQATLSPKYVLRNASDAYLEAERQELAKLPSSIYIRRL